MGLAKILTGAPNVQRSNIEDANLYDFYSRGVSGIMHGRLNECDITLSGLNGILISTGILLLQGHPVKIVEPFSWQFLEQGNYHLVAIIVVGEILSYTNQQGTYVMDSGGTREIDFFITPRKVQSLIQDNLINSMSSGTFEYELSTFTVGENGIVSNLVITAEVITPQGERGPAGPQGPQGEKGEPGEGGEPATNDTFGTVKGSLERGNVSIQNDKMVVNGYLTDLAQKAPINNPNFTGSANFDYLEASTIGSGRIGVEIHLWAQEIDTNYATIGNLDVDDFRGNMINVWDLYAEYFQLYSGLIGTLQTYEFYSDYAEIEELHVKKDLYGNIVEANSFTGKYLSVEGIYSSNIYTSYISTGIIEANSVKVQGEDVFHPGNPQTTLDTPSYLTFGTPPNYEVTIPDFKVGNIYLIEFHMNTTGAASNIKVNGGVNRPIYIYGTTIAGDSAVIRAGLVSFILFYEMNCRFVSHSEAVNFASRAVYSVYGVYGGFSIITTMNTMQDLYLRLGYVNCLFNSSFVEKQGGSVSIELVENIRTRDTSIPSYQRERFTVNIRWDLPAISSGAVFQSTIPDIQVEVDGEMYDTKPEDVIVVITNNTTSSKTLMLIIKSHRPDKIFQINPINRYGGSFSNNNVNLLSWYTSPSTAGPIPTAVQGDYVHAIYSRSVSREVILFKGSVNSLTITKEELRQFDSLDVVVTDLEYAVYSPSTTITITKEQMEIIQNPPYLPGVLHKAFILASNAQNAMIIAILSLYGDDNNENWEIRFNQYGYLRIKFDNETGQSSKYPGDVSELRILEIIGKRRALV